MTIIKRTLQINNYLVNLKQVSAWENWRVIYENQKIVMVFLSYVKGLMPNIQNVVVHTKSEQYSVAAPLYEEISTESNLIKKRPRTAYLPFQAIVAKSIKVKQTSHQK